MRDERRWERKERAKGESNEENEKSIREENMRDGRRWKIEGERGRER